MNRALREKTILRIKRIILCTLVILYKLTFGLYLRLRYKVKLTPGSKIRIKGPCLLLSNHCNSYDGLYLQYFMQEPLHFVVTDTVFKNKILRMLFSLADYIPKKKFVSDAKTIKKIIKTVKNAGAVGIFPEGARSWDGKSLCISGALYKLVKLLKIPVVTAKISGAYFSSPRWADTKRRGRIEIDIKLLLDSDDVMQMSLRDIEEKISSALEHNDFDWQRQNMVPFRGKALAKGLERLIYMCPECQNIGTLHTAGDKLWCRACSAEYRIDEYGFLHSVNGHLPAQNINGLSDWQYEQLERIITATDTEDGIILSDNDAKLLASESDDDPFRVLDKGLVILNKKELIIGSYSFKIKGIHGLSIYFKSGLSFRYGPRDYRVCFVDRRISVYKWCSALGLLKGIKRRSFDG